MAKQVIISVSREYGSGGHKIAEELAKRFSLPYYDRNLLDEIAHEKELKDHKLHKYDEVPRNIIFSRTVRGYSNSPEEVIARMQFDYLRKKAEKGDSFVVVGRCAEDILKDFDAMMSFFIIADMETKLQLVQETRKVSREEAESIIRRHDKKRKAYHNYYCQTKWGDARNYDMTINCSALGIEKTTDIIEDYIRMKMEMQE
ncbi:MAG: cytidylate kinase-like family protein [Lachnospiraceae bacterium]|nr:cytidylate kinase-like family protein [Lachnospiraceae bacterium]